MPRPRTRIIFQKPDRAAWYYDWTIEGHRVRGSTGETKKAAAEKVALAIRQRLVDELRLGQAPRAEPLTLTQALARYSEEYAAELKTFDFTVVTHCRHLLRELGPDLPLDRIDDAAVADLVARLRGRTLAELRPSTETIARDSPLRKRRLGPASINRTLNTLAAVLRRSREVWKLPAASPAINQLRPTESAGREVFLNPGQARAIGEGIVAHARPIVALAVLTGLRRGNVLRLDWREVDLEHNLVTVQVKSRKPGGRTHSVNLMPEARAILEAIAPKDARHRQGAVFRFGQMDCDCQWCKDHRGEPIKGIKRAWRTARRGAGIDGVRFHDLRHTVASALLNKGHDLHMVQKVLGHADAKTTQRYAHLQDAVRARAMTDSLAGFAPRISKRLGAHKSPGRSVRAAKSRQAID